MLNKFFNSLEITPNQVKIFFVTFIAMFIMAGLKHLGVHAPITIPSLDK